MEWNFGRMPCLYQDNSVGQQYTSQHESYSTAMQKVVLHSGKRGGIECTAYLRLSPTAFWAT